MLIFHSLGNIMFIIPKQMYRILQDIIGQHLGISQNSKYHSIYIGYSIFLIHQDTGFFKKNSHPMKYHTIEVMSPASPNSMLSSEFCAWRPSKKQPFLLIMLGTSDHNIEVGGCGGKHSISAVSSGWLFFLKNPVRFFGSEFFV